jgi:Zn-dependent protease/predicted transcriptional regulator
MKRVPSLGRVRGVRLRLHYTWYIAFILITIAVATQFPEAYPLWQRIVLGLFGSVLFLIAISLREAALFCLALRRGIPVKNIALFIFGGVSQANKEATLPILELLMGIAGLLANLFLAVMFYFIYLALVSAGSIMIAAIVQWLAFISIMLTFFHFLPCFPLDGGRILCALLWRTTGSYHLAARLAFWIGWGMGIIFTFGGIALLIFTGQRLTGAVLALVGWALWRAVAYSRRRALLQETLQNITAQHIMSRDYPLVNRELSLGQLIRDWILVTGQHYFLVTDGTKWRGVITPKNVKSVPKKRWDSTTVSQIMTPARVLGTAQPGQSALSVIERMDELGISEMPVLDGGKVVGVVTRERLNQLARACARFGG